MTPTRRCLLGVFAHPDDETSRAGGTFSRTRRFNDFKADKMFSNDRG